MHSELRTLQFRQVNGSCLLLRALGEFCLFVGSWVTGTFILDLLLLFCWWRVSLKVDFLPFRRGLVGFVDGFHETDESICCCGFNELGG